MKENVFRKDIFSQQKTKEKKIFWRKLTAIGIIILLGGIMSYLIFHNFQRKLKQIKKENFPAKKNILELQRQFQQIFKLKYSTTSPTSSIRK